MPYTYLTVPEELVEYADIARRYYRTNGYSLRIEPSDMHFPAVPTFTARLQHTTLVCDVQAKVNLERATSLMQYAKTANKDTRVVIILPDTTVLRPKIESELARLGVGVLICSTEEAYSKLAAKDQALSLELPPLTQLPMRVRRALAPAYEKFNHHDWREGFKSACQALEVEARTYLKDGIARGRIQLVTSAGNVSSISITTIERATQGQLAKLFGRIISPNTADAALEKALTILNDDRVRAIHHEKKPGTEAKLRRSVGQHMFVIINALKTLHDRQ